MDEKSQTCQASVIFSIADNADDDSDQRYETRR